VGFSDYSINLGGALICGYTGVGPDAIVNRSAVKSSVRGPEVAAKEGRVGEVAQIDLPAGGLADDAAVVGPDAVGPRRLAGPAELPQGHGGGAARGAAAGILLVSFAITVILEHGQKQTEELPTVTANGTAHEMPIKVFPLSFGSDDSLPGMGRVIPPLRPVSAV